MVYTVQRGKCRLGAGKCHFVGQMCHLEGVNCHLGRENCRLVAKKCRLGCKLAARTVALQRAAARRLGMGEGRRRSCRRQYRARCVVGKLPVWLRPIADVRRKAIVLHVRLASFLAFALSITAAPGIASARAPGSMSKDAVVYGTVENIDYEGVSDPDDLLGHGWVTARLHVTRVVSGRVPSSAFTIKYFAHTYMYEDRVFRFHLRLSPKGDYVVCTQNGEGVRCR